jgi:cytoskeletal protein RodZ
MPTLGEEIKRRREERDITLTDISEATKISTRYLKAIESDNYSILPGGIFTRSFIRAFAKQVGMSEDEAIGLYHQQLGQSAEPQSQPATDSRPVSAPAVEQRPRRSDPVVFHSAPTRASWPTIVIGAGIILFIVIVVLALVKKLSWSEADQAASNSAAAQQSEPAKPSPQPAQTQPAQTQPAQQPAAATEAPPPQVPAGEPLVVKIEAATGECWLRYQVDDAKPSIVTLKQGETQDIPPAQTQVKLNIGNRQTIKLSINNREAIFPPNTPKFAAQLTITRDNLQTFFQ